MCFLYSWVGLITNWSEQQSLVIDLLVFESMHLTWQHFANQTKLGLGPARIFLFGVKSVGERKKERKKLNSEKEN
jgi:hypothetical protein